MTVSALITINYLSGAEEIILIINFNNDSWEAVLI